MRRPDVRHRRNVLFLYLFIFCTLIASHALVLNAFCEYNHLLHDRFFPWNEDEESRGKKKTTNKPLSTSVKEKEKFAIKI